MKTPKLTVVGAGPGDPRLLTLKAIDALKNADVVLYDALVNESLLTYAEHAAEIVFVGKRKGYARYSQDEINEMIVQKAYTHGHVVRLKGGDPFVFGRGTEELVYASLYNLETESVPGISSALAVASGQNIPLTLRGNAESFWVITGTTKNKKLSDDVALAARSTATIVILMGMSHLPEIVQIFEKVGKSELPVAIIQNGTTPHEKIGVGRVKNIIEVVRNNKLTNPAIIVLGEVVNQRERILQIQAEHAFNSLIA
ncbi:uroporphyrin-III C-methyltransferase [Lishizhenia tianjinensis]|uniref:uroporphyrinogen-III C-methyltransferase n=1 Tax=Lishizhenia tianjinensis TaxID=477690 RepID=A0A1I6YD49_9FLAO|nr:uroporphyrinogen-III C-methyltransferase [Lishizhenia tianjinensis]SFT48449.1 uroporphyrin-III C-methyltransferase [Lishizhenia tianjinensis]